MSEITIEMKRACLGEFRFSHREACGHCLVEGYDEECPVCDGEISVCADVAVPWSTCKEIYTKMCEHAPQSKQPSDGPSAIQAVKDLSAIYDESPRDIIDALIGTLWGEEEAAELNTIFSSTR